MRVPVGVPGEGLGARFRWVVGGVACGKEGKREEGGEGGGWGGVRQKNRQVNAHAFVKTSL